MSPRQLAPCTCGHGEAVHLLRASHGARVRGACSAWNCPCTAYTPDGGKEAS